MKIIIIGGGAAGFFAAINCAENYPNSQVILLESGSKVLSKVLISGGGRCNVTNSCFDVATLVLNYPRGGKVLRGAFTRFQPQNTINWFTQRGVNLKTESDNRIFPITDNSATIANCLIDSAINAGVKIMTNFPVINVEFNPHPPTPYPTREGEKFLLDFEQGENYPHKFVIKLKSGENMECDRILLATGSNPIGYKIAQNLGHNIITPVPSLFTFNIDDIRIKELAGLSVESVKLCLKFPGKTDKIEQTGAVLITHWGLSGPGILKLSAWGARILNENHYQGDLIINWLPKYNGEILRQEILKIKEDWSKKTILGNCPFQLPKRLWQRLGEYVGINSEQKWAELGNKTINQLILELTQGTYKIKGKGVFKEEFVTCGGVDLKEIDFKTMESKKCAGLYLAGEILDIDGITGGFNFQSAWTTGWIAGQNMGIKNN